MSPDTARWFAAWTPTRPAHLSTEMPTFRQERDEHHARYCKHAGCGLVTEPRHRAEDGAK